ncbi:MAG: glucosamine-6-phosphate deaminase [Propionibacteriaceae bacterium]|nr:glucosamine-6-phosphate deaminase [Propionibacteriaceae bacterium]
MEVIICRDEHQVGVLSAAKIAHIAVTIGPGIVLGVATGSSPLATYAELKRLTQRGYLRLGAAYAFALDEYVGLPADHPLSYHEEIRRTVAEPLGLDPIRVYVPDGALSGLSTAGQRYEDLIRSVGGIDVQILGLGENGHVGFNEPTSSLTSRTRMKTLAPSTRQANARFFPNPDDVPRHCVTQGLGTIMEARNIVLVATGEDKADAVANVIEGPISAMCPGSVLQMHQNTTVIVDETAASQLTLTDYYKAVYDDLPTWQRLDLV